MFSLQPMGNTIEQMGQNLEGKATMQCEIEKEFSLIEVITKRELWMPDKLSIFDRDK